MLGFCARRMATEVTRRQAQNTPRGATKMVIKMRQKLKWQRETANQPIDPRKKATNLFWFRVDACVSTSTCQRIQECILYKYLYRPVFFFEYIFLRRLLFVVTFVHHFFFNHDRLIHNERTTQQHWSFTQLKINRMQTTMRIYLDWFDVWRWMISKTQFHAHLDSAVAVNT